MAEKIQKTITGTVKNKITFEKDGVKATYDIVTFDIKPSTPVNLILLDSFGALWTYIIDRPELVRLTQPVDQFANGYCETHDRYNVMEYAVAYHK